MGQVNQLIIVAWRKRIVNFIILNIFLRSDQYITIRYYYRIASCTASLTSLCNRVTDLSLTSFIINVADRQTIVISCVVNEDGLVNR